MEITIPRLSDMHAHLRQGDLQDTILCHHQWHTHYIVAMPNTNPPLVIPEDTYYYKGTIEKKAPELKAIVPLYLTEDTQDHHILEASMRYNVKSCKLYPRGATTGSQDGVSLEHLERLDKTFQKMADRHMILSIHAEDPGPGILSAEARALLLLEPLCSRYPGLKIIIEHITTAAGVLWVQEQGPNVAGTITPHHMLLTLDDLLLDGIRPDLYCKPVVKRNEDRSALIHAATSGNPKFFLGSDSAPHQPTKKYCKKGAAGIFNAPVLPELLATIFERNGSIDKLADFASNFGADFYGLPRCQETITLTNDSTADIACPIACLTIPDLHWGPAAKTERQRPSKTYTAKSRRGEITANPSRRTKMAPRELQDQLSTSPCLSSGRKQRS